MKPVDGRALTLRARGIVGEYHWEFRGDITSEGASHWIDFRHSEGSGGGGSGGAGGALPFADLGWKVCGHTGGLMVSGGWSRQNPTRKRYRPTTVSGAVSSSAARVIAVFDGAQDVVAQLFESGRADIRFFLAMQVERKALVEIVVLDEIGRVLDRVPSPSDMGSDTQARIRALVAPSASGGACG